MKTYLLPENLNFQTHLKHYPPSNYRIPKFDLDSAKYLLTLISSVPLKNNDIEEELQDPEKGGFIPLSSVLMRDAVYNYNYYWSYFEKTGIVSIKRGYKSSIDGDGECMGYKFTGEYEFADFRKEKCKKPIESKKDKLLEGIARKRYPDATRGLLKGLGFDSQGARDFNKKKLVAQKKDASLIELSKKGHNQEKDPDKQYKRSSQCIDLLENKDYYYNIDNFGRRLYWNLTSLPSFLRNFLSYKGPAGKERLICIDIGNSQPYFSSLLLDKKFYEASGGKRSSETTITFKNLTRENMSALKEISESLLQIINSKNKDIGLYNSLVSSSSTIDILSFNSSINSGLSNRYIYSFFYNRSIYNFSLFKSKYSLLFSSSLMLQRCRKYEVYLSDNESCIKDGKIYQSILKNKSSLDLYEYMSNKSREDGSGYKTRKEMKTKMMIVYFSKNRHFKEEKESFKASFPTVHKLFRVIKKKEHQLLACVLQNIESHAVLNKLIPRLKNEFPQMPVYPIHDSITVPESYKDQVLAIMKEELLRLVGFPPRLKVEYWDPKNLEALEQMYDQVINKK